ncbi:MAG: pilus assembly protein PilP [Nitrospiraceae bacterium]|nr:pilus assembly protein PilP [Nitrospiraceae bacterium]
MGTGPLAAGPVILVFTAALLLALALSCPRAASARAGNDYSTGPVARAGSSVAPSIAPAGKKPAPAPEVKGQEAGDQSRGNQSHAYRSAGRRDPFLSLIYAAVRAKEEMKGRMLIPLEQYEVNQMTLVAVIMGPGIPSYALVRLPDGKHYSLRYGSVVGINKGKVVKITPDHIVVQETVTDFMGRKNTRETVLKLRE